MTARAILRVGACLLGLVAVTTLGACEQTKQALGQTKQSPDEFAVFKRAPLSIPPDYQLRPPAPGADRPQAVNPRDRAREAVIGQEGKPGVGPVAKGPAVATVAGASPGELAILKQAGALKADPNIRREVNEESYALAQDEEHTLAKKILFWQKPNPTGVAVDPEAEAKRIREAQALGKPLNKGKVPIIVRKKKGFLEGVLN